MLDNQEKTIVKALIKDPRMSDNEIGKTTGVPIRTVNRKRKKLEERGFINYYTNVNMQATERFSAKHLFLIKFAIGTTRKQILEDIKNEPKVKTRFTELISQSFLSEWEGNIALAMIIEGKNDANIIENVHEKVLPQLKKNHGEHSIEKIMSIRLDEQLRIFHNYLPTINVKNGKMVKDWPDEQIFVE